MQKGQNKKRNQGGGQAVNHFRSLAVHALQMYVEYRLGFVYGLSRVCPGFVWGLFTVCLEVSRVLCRVC